MFIRDIRIGCYPEQTLEISPNTLHGRFQLHTCCISDHLLYMIKQRVITPDISKIILLMNSNEKQVNPIIDKYDGVVTIESYFDFNYYISLETDIDKKRIISNTVRVSFQNLFSHFQWNFEPVDTALQYIESHNFKFEGILKPTWVSPNRRFTVRLWFNYKLESVQFDAILYKYRSNRELCRRFFSVIRPAEGCIYDYLTNVHWKSNTVLESHTADFAKKIACVDFADVINVLK